jgi:hypothetical protein
LICIHFGHFYTFHILFSLTKISQAGCLVRRWNFDTTKAHSLVGLEKNISIAFEVSQSRNNQTSKHSAGIRERTVPVHIQDEQQDQLGIEFRHHPGSQSRNPRPTVSVRVTLTVFLPDNSHHEHLCTTRTSGIDKLNLHSTLHGL